MAKYAVKQRFSLSFYPAVKTEQRNQASNKIEFNCACYDSLL